MNNETSTRPRRNSFGGNRSQQKNRGQYKKNNSFKNRNRNGRNFGGSNRGKKFARNNFDPSQFINKAPQTPVIEEKFTPIHTFEQFKLSSELVATLHKMAIKTPTPIQDKVIPEMLKSRDIVGLAETGTGKTAAFLLPLIELTLSDPKRQTLIVTPTRELAAQIETEFKALSRGLNMHTVVCVGGVGIGPQISALQRRPQFIVGTPGRLIDLINRGRLQTDKLSAVVLDEADRMLDMGFIDDIRTILEKTPPQRETYLFSATITSAAQKLVKDFLKDPIEISVKKKDTIESISQDIVTYSPDTKFEKLIETLGEIKKGRIIIFGAMKQSVEKLSKQLKRSGYSADSIHGNKSHSQRKRSLDGFKSGRTDILVATDVAARGIHVDNVSHVINYDLPSTFEDYIHRIGRTGRAHKLGKALTFVPKNHINQKRKRSF